MDENQTFDQDRIIRINIEEEMKSSYIDYSMSVIVARALPDVRDGFKPVHRRILYGMAGIGNTSDKPYKKCARVVGEVLGKYHPHGDSSVYGALVRMAQDWNMRYTLVDGQGNFGSVDGDSPAAMRYTECRLSKMGEHIMDDLEKDTVDMVNNFDDSLQEPTVMPTKVPNLLVNGGNGIAVGMATNMPTHNLGEVIDGCCAYIDNPDIDTEGLMQFIPGPDFPTGAYIYGLQGVRDAYETGRGRIVMRAKAEIESHEHARQDCGDGDSLWREQGAAHRVHRRPGEGRQAGRHLQRQRRVRPSGHAYRHRREERCQCQRHPEQAVQDDRPAELILSELHRAGERQTTPALAEGMREILCGAPSRRDHPPHQIRPEEGTGACPHSGRTDHRREQHRRGGAHHQKLEDAHRRPAQPGSRFNLDELQSKAIVDMRLSQLTGLRVDQLHQEYDDLMKLIADLQEILDNPERCKQVMKDELQEVKEKYGDERRTQIVPDEHEFNAEDFYPNDPVVITVSHLGYIKRTPLSEFREQARGGVGAKAAKTRDQDFTEFIYPATMHQTMLFFTRKGRCYWLKCYEIPEGDKNSKGRAIQNMLNIESDDSVNNILRLRGQGLEDEDFINTHYVVFATKKGIVKKTCLRAYSRPRANGVIAINIMEGDEVVDVRLTNGENELIMANRNGRAVRFNEHTVRNMGRVATGVRGMRLDEGDDAVVGMVVVNRPDEENIMVVSENGYGKRSEVEDYRKTNRGGKGVKTLNITEKTGRLVAIKNVTDQNDLMIINKSGIVIRLSVADCRVMGRATQGVRLINLTKKNDVIASVCKVMSSELEAIVEQKSREEWAQTNDAIRKDMTTDSTGNAEVGNNADEEENSITPIVDFADEEPQDGQD